MQSFATKSLALQNCITPHEPEDSAAGILDAASVSASTSTQLFDFRLSALLHTLYRACYRHYTEPEERAAGSSDATCLPTSMSMQSCDFQEQCAQ